MRLTASVLTGAFILLVTFPAQADDYYGYGYRSDRYCDHHFGSIHSDYRRLKRENDRLQRRLISQSRTCAEAAQQQNVAYQQVISQQRGFAAQATEQQETSGEIIRNLADAKGIPEELLERPTRDEHDALQERYDRLLQAYRNLERDHRALTGTN
ncbi:MAG: hypothetical protein ACE363_11025 [Alphaproteobacteria bacterium]